jgi:hypothetical protein
MIPYTFPVWSIRTGTVNRQSRTPREASLGAEDEKQPWATPFWGGGFAGHNLTPNVKLKRRNSES